MRLGEIIQMQVADVKWLDGIYYFDVTPLACIDTEDDEGEELGEEEKSLKTSSSRRSIRSIRRSSKLALSVLLLAS